MIRRLVGALLVLPCAALAQQPLSGSFVYESPAGAVTLVLQQQGNAVSGTMRGADGSLFQLQGGVEAEGATGSISTEGGAGFFAVGWVGGQLQLVVAEVDPSTGEPDLSSGWSLAFNPASPAPPAVGAVPSVPQAGQPGAPENVERDPSLVGLWEHTETYQSGDFFGNTTVRMQVNSDGTYLYGNGNVSLGGAYMGNTGPSGDVTTGEWRTEGGVVYVREQGMPQWAPHARYYVEGGSLMFTFGDGTRQLWERR